MKSNCTAQIIHCVLLGFFLCVPAFAGLPRMKTNKPLLELQWQTEAIFGTPESIIYDEKRDVLYVGNFNTEGGFLRPNKERNTEFISKLSTAGKLLKLEWIMGLDAPTGMTIYNDLLYVVERGNLVEIDIEKAKVVRRTVIPDARFPNDIAFDRDGSGYISDNNRDSKTSIHRYINGIIEPWMSVEKVRGPNGLFVDGKELIAYDNNTTSLVAINLADKKIRNIAAINSNARAIGDGLVKIDETTYLLTAWSGPSWLVAADGTVTDLLDTTTMTGAADGSMKNADSGYISDKHLWLIPTFLGNKILAYKLNIP